MMNGLLWFFGIGYGFVGILAAMGANEVLKNVGLKRVFVFGFVLLFWGVLYVDTMIREAKR